MRTPHPRRPKPARPDAIATSRERIDIVNIAVPAFDRAPGQLAPSFDRGRRPLKLTHLEELEAESVHIIREAVAESERPVLLYSIGKDSSVLLHLAAKAFFPGKLPFPVLHIDTT